MTRFIEVVRERESYDEIYFKFKASYNDLTELDLLGIFKYYIEEKMKKVKEKAPADMVIGGIKIIKPKIEKGVVVES